MSEVSKIANGIEKVFLEYYRKIDGEWATFTKVFNSLPDCMEFVSVCDSVYTFKIRIVREKNS